MEPPHLFFWKPEAENGWLSNWSMHGFCAVGVWFRTAEHFIMYRKALAMGDTRSAQRVLGAGTPAGAKAIGREIANWDEEKWVQVREDVMFQALSLKIEAHPGLKAMLLQTCGRVLAEASPYDSIWGIGCSKTDPRARNPATWPGMNLLGRSWMKVREMALGGE